MAGYVPLREDLESFDFRVTAGVNGDGGGTYAPFTPIVFTTDPTTSAFTVTGPLALGYGGVLTTRLGARILLPTGEYEKIDVLHPGRARTIVTPCSGGFGYPSFAVRPHLATGGLQAVALRFHLDTGDAPASDVPARWGLDLRTHHNATLASVTLTYLARLGTPRARILRVDTNGERLPITTIMAGTDDGWVALPAADPALAVQTARVVADPVVVDKAAYDYLLEVEEDQTLGVAYPNYLTVKARAKLATTADILLRNTPTLDGYTTQVGDVILARAQANAAENGLWIVQGTGLDFLRPGTVTVGGITFTFPQTYPQGFLVPVRYGTAFGNTVWQMTSPTVATLGTSPQTFVTAPSDPLSTDNAFAAAGNVYLAAAAHFTGIADTRWQ